MNSAKPSILSQPSNRPEPLFDWFIPIDGDGVRIGTNRAERPPSFSYLRQVVETAKDFGFHSLLIPTRFANGLFDEGAPLAETWTMVTALGAVTIKVRFLVAVRPGFISTGLFAQMAAPLDQITDGRLDINVVPGGIQGDFERLGVVSGHGDRYARAEEFIGACRALWRSSEPVKFDGEYVRLNGAMCSPGPVGEGPKFYLGGASERALALAGRQSDVYLMWIETREKTALHLEQAREQFDAAGRFPSFGLRTHLIARDSESEAWRVARDLLSEAKDGVKAQRSAVYAGTPMVGQHAQAQQVADHRIGLHLWNGISTVRVNCATAIVGSYDQVANELLEYWRLGIDEFILSGFPHVEECRRVASELLPIVSSLIRDERIR